MNSLSSSLMLGVTLTRNTSDGGKIFAAVGYPLITMIALVETVVATVFTTLSILAIPLSTDPLRSSIVWLTSSGFTIFWAFFDTILNPFMHTLIANEEAAKQSFVSGRLFQVPRGAIF